MSAFDTLKKSASTSTKKKTDVTSIVNPDLNDVCDQVIEAAAAAKNATAAKKFAEQEVISFARSFHSESIKQGEPVKSYRVNDKLLCIFTDKWSNVSEEDQQELAEKLSEEQLTRLFQQKAVIKVKDTVASNDARLEELLNLLGPENVERFFDVGVNLIPTKDFDKAVAREGCYEEIEDVMTRIRSKPTIRVAT